MDKKLIEKYKNEMFNTYAKRKFPTVEKAVQTISPVADNAANNEGSLVVLVTAVRSLYPIKNALVTVFSGENETRENIISVYTDESGKTEPIYLSAPDRQLSLESENKVSLGESRSKAADNPAVYILYKAVRQKIQHAGACQHLFSSKKLFSRDPQSGVAQCSGAW